VKELCTDGCTKAKLPRLQNKVALCSVSQEMTLCFVIGECDKLTLFIAYTDNLLSEIEGVSW
jgi:hypothetical protein